VLQAAMMSLAFKEGLSFPPAALNKVIVAANQDIRQVSQQSVAVSLCRYRPASFVVGDYVF